MNILHLDSSILGGHSVSRDLSARLVVKLAAAVPDARLTYRDIGTSPVPHLSGATIMAAQAGAAAPSPGVAQDLAIGAELFAA